MNDEKAFSVVFGYSLRPRAGWSYLGCWLSCSVIFRRWLFDFWEVAGLQYPSLLLFVVGLDSCICGNLMLGASNLLCLFSCALK